MVKAYSKGWPSGQGLRLRVCNFTKFQVRNFSSAINSFWVSPYKVLFSFQLKLSQVGGGIGPPKLVKMRVNWFGHFSFKKKWMSMVMRWNMYVKITRDPWSMKKYFVRVNDTPVLLWLMICVKLDSISVAAIAAMMFHNCFWRTWESVAKADQIQQTKTQTWFPRSRPESKNQEVIINHFVIWATRCNVRACEFCWSSYLNLKY